MKLKEFCEISEANKLKGDVDIDIDGLVLVGGKPEGESCLSYATGFEYIENAERCSFIKALVVSPKDYDCYQGRLSLIVSKDPERTFYDIHEYLIRETKFYKKEKRSSIGSQCSIEASAYIDENVVIGNRVVIGAGTVIKAGTVLGDDTHIGNNCVIGGEGFQVLNNGTNIRRIAHAGFVEIGNNVSIGDNVTVSRSLFKRPVVISPWVSIDSQVHIAHNCSIGKKSIITAGVTLCGSVTIEAGVWVGVNTSIKNKICIGERAIIGMGSVVTHNVYSDTLVYGSPAKLARSLS